MVAASRPPLPLLPAKEPSALTEIAHFCSRHPIALVGGALVGLVAAVALTAWQVPTYQATATLEIQDLNDNFLNSKELSPLASPTQTGATSDMQTQLRVLRSDTLLERALGKAPAERPLKESALRALIHKVRGGGNAVVNSESLLDSARNRLQVKETRQARIVDISFDSADPNFAATLANTLAQEYIDQNIEWRWKMSQQTAQWLGGQLEETRRKLAASEDALQHYARQAGLLLTNEKETLSEERLRQAQNGLLTAQQERMAREAKLETAMAAPPNSTLDGVADSALKDLQSKLTDLRRQRADLATVFKPNFDSVKRLDAQIATLEAAIKTERTAVLQRLRNDYNDAVRREKLLQESYARQAGQVSRDTEKSIQYGILKRDVDSNRQLYEVMLQRVKEASVASALRASNIRILDPARTPRRPYKPTLFLNILWGLTAGLLLGGMFAAVGDRADQGVRKPGDLGHVLDVPELGAVPSIDGAQGARLGYSRGVLSGPIVDISPGSITGLASAGPTIERHRLELVTWQQRSSQVAESFRAILTSILFSNQTYDPPRVVVVTSCRPGEGKTTVACNLAVAMARMDRRVLIIDGDLSQPRLDHIFETSNEYGLSDLPSLNLQRNALHYVSQKSSIPGLFVLASGPDIANAADLLHSPAFASVLAQSREDFDFIVIDAPALDNRQDARILSRLADGVVLVVRAGNANRDRAIAAARRLIDDGSVLLGTVLNRWDRK